ncbi:MAG: N-acetyl-gamma-glutamyl-phosphate reductase [Promethearchaeota archaeon]|jgi:N-acetyl-gamma-glutamyl-phosphate reductase
MTIKAGILGATGYVGSELIRILSHHPEVEIKVLTSQKHNDQIYHTIYENFSNICDLKCEENDLEVLANQLDIIFLALPHGVTSKMITEKILNMVQVIDLSADFRLNSIEAYEKWYENKHQNENLIRRAVFGLCEWKRREINEAKLIANPGCYPTCALLCLLPLVKEGIIDTKGIIIDAKSGISGAGRSLNLATHFTECNESIKAYKVMSHRHTPEIEQQLSEINGNAINILFTPHLVPMNRGILCTCYGDLKEQVNFDEIKQVFEKYYSKENFIRLKRKGVLPETRWVKGSNYCDIGFTIDKRASKIIIIGAIDNLIKGAAGQAVQNMNIMFNLEETMGLKSIPMFPV